MADGRGGSAHSGWTKVWTRLRWAALLPSVIGGALGVGFVVSLGVGLIGARLRFWPSHPYPIPRFIERGQVVIDGLPVLPPLNGLGGRFR